MRRLRYGWNLFCRVFSLSFSSMLIYRSNIIFFFIFGSLFFLGNLVIAHSGVEYAGGSIQGWTKNDVFVLTAFNNMAHQFFLVFCSGTLFSIPYDVTNGKMDFTLLKPLRPLVGLFATHEFVISNIPNFIFSTAAFFYFLLQAQSQLLRDNIVLFILLFPVALGVRFGFGLLTLAPCFISEKLNDNQNTYWNVLSLARFPTSVFPRLLQILFSSILPLAFVATIPSAILLQHPLDFPLRLTAGFSVVFVVVSYWFFMFCLKKYSSVNAGFN